MRGALNVSGGRLTSFMAEQIIILFYLLCYMLKTTFNSKDIIFAALMQGRQQTLMLIECKLQRYTLGHFDWSLVNTLLGLKIH